MISLVALSEGTRLNGEHQKLSVFLISGAVRPVIQILSGTIYLRQPKKYLRWHTSQCIQSFFGIAV